MKKEHNVTLCREEWLKVVESLDDLILDYTSAKHPKARDELVTLSHIQGLVMGQLKAQGFRID